MQEDKKKMTTAVHFDYSQLWHTTVSLPLSDICVKEIVSENRPSLDRITTGMWWTSNHQVMGLVVNM